MTLLYINDTLVDLPPKFDFATTILKADFSDLTKRNINYTNSVKLQWTPAVLALFGFALYEKSGTMIPYQKLTAKVIQNGVETISDGVAWVVSADATGVVISVYENLATLFDAITGKSVTQLYYLTPSSWLAAGIDTARLATTGAKTLILSWGMPGALYQFSFFLPSFFYYEMVQAILKQTGLLLSGAILTDTRFTDLLIPYFKEKWEYPAGVLTALNQSAQRTTTINMGTIDDQMYPTVNYRVPLTAFIDPIAAPSNTIDLATCSWVVPNIGSPDGVDFAEIFLDGNINVDINWSDPVFGDLRAEWFRIRDGVTTNIGSSLPYANAGVGPEVGVAISLSPGGLWPIRNGDTVFYVLRNGSAPYTCDVIVNTADLIISNYGGGVNRSLVNWNFMLGDIQQMDIIRDFTVRFGIVYKQVGSTLFLKTLQEIITDISSAVDWTSKRVKFPQDDQLVFKGLNYGQRNTFDHNDVLDDATLGQGLVLINNKILEAERSVFSSEFENCPTSTIDGGKKAVIPVYGAGATGISTFINEPGLKLVTQRARIAGEPSITFNGVARSDYKVGYFVDSLQTKDTSFSYFLDQFYPALKTALQTAKTITRHYNLTETDISTYDPHKMIYDDGSYFIVDTIDKFVPGKFTKVVLFKIQ